MVSIPISFVRFICGHSCHLMLSIVPESTTVELNANLQVAELLLLGDGLDLKYYSSKRKR